MAVSAKSMDGQAHSVKIYSDISAEWVSGDNGLIANWTTRMDLDILTHQVQLAKQTIFAEINDHTECKCNALLFRNFFYSNVYRRFRILLGEACKCLEDCKLHLLIDSLLRALRRHSKQEETLPYAHSSSIPASSWALWTPTSELSTITGLCLPLLRILGQSLLSRNLSSSRSATYAIP